MKNTDTSKHLKRQSQYFQPNVLGLSEKISYSMRKKMFQFITQIMQPAPQISVLDVGVGAEDRIDGNFFEKMYPYANKIVAVGVEDASYLEHQFPGLKFHRLDGTSLPFPDKHFDWVVSFATLEHVGNRDRQRQFIHELCRVGKSFCITTPNRWYPLEFHTILPFVHWLPPRWFRRICRMLGKEFFSKEENLNLLGQKDVLGLFPAHAQVHTKNFYLLGLVSNLMFYSSKNNQE